MYAVCKQYLYKKKTSMFKLKSNNFSIRINTDELDIVNEVLQEIQEVESIEYASYKDMFLDCMQRAKVCTPTVNKVDTLENNLIKDLLAEFRVNNDVNKDASDFDTLLAALKFACNPPLPEPQTIEVEKEIEIEKEITVEVEKALTENQVLVEFESNEMELVKKITDNRNLKLSEENQETPSLMIRKMVLNKANINNWHGAFYTGFDKIF